MPKIRIRWHDYEWFDEVVVIPDEQYDDPDFDLGDFAYDYIGDFDQYTTYPSSTECDVDYVGLADDQEGA